MKLIIPLLAISILLSCSKEKPSRYNERFKISFKIDGKEYSTVLMQDAMNLYTASGLTTGTTGVTYTLGPTFKVGPTTQIFFVLGNYHYVYNDSVGNLARLKHLLRPGTKNFACINNCDTALVDAVQVSFVDDPQGLLSFSTTKLTTVNGHTMGIIDQAGSHFTITEMKESSTNGISKNAVIIKGSFRCTLYEAVTHNAKQLTGGQFTCIIPVL